MLSRKITAGSGALLALLVAAAPYSDGPPPAHTGGFGEPTCHHCHADNESDDLGTVLTATLPEAFARGTSYPVRLRLERSGMGAAGFELSARFAAGPAAGRQAGRFEVSANHLQVLKHDSVDYAAHARSGLSTDAKFREWELFWMAPDTNARVVFHIAANAANGDDSEFGDFVVTRSFIAEPDTTASRKSG